VPIAREIGDFDEDAWALSASTEASTDAGRDEDELWQETRFA